MHLQNLDYVPTLPDGFSCRNEKQIMAERLSKRIWRTKSQSSALLPNANKTHFHKKDRALGLILKIKDFGTPKWPTGVQ